MVPSTTFPNPRRFPQQQEVVKSTCRCMYWFRRLKYCAPCHPVVFAFAPSSCWLRLELFFDDYTNFNGGQSDLQRRSTNLRFWNLTLVLQLTIRKSIFLVVSLWEVASGTDASTELETTSKIDFLQVNCSTNVKFQKSQICRAPLKIRLPAVEVRKNHWLALFQCATSWCLLVWCLWSLTAGGGSLWSMLVVCSAGRCTRGRCGEEECSNFKRLRMMETILDFQVNRKVLGKNPILKRPISSYWMYWE